MVSVRWPKISSAQWEPKLWHNFYLARSTENISFGLCVGTKTWGLEVELCTPIGALRSSVNLWVSFMASSLLPDGEAAQSFLGASYFFITFTLEHPRGLWSLRLLSSSRNFLLLGAESLGIEFPEKLSCVKLSSVYF